MAFDKSMLGHKVKDMVSGFTGTATAVHHYMNGCTRVSITSDTLDEKGNPTDPFIFDDAQVEIVKKTEKPMAKHMKGDDAVPTKTVGGPRGVRNFK